ncbi:MAG: alpha/beta hydrolase [Pseudonocardiales bacterium]|nr:alpha/beta hydrolase [Pseudonocardiales bacterium]MBW0011355.1 alpha/beta hydrolase [Pseudonocardiales bacterium]
MRHRIPQCLGVLMTLLVMVLTGGCTAGPSNRPSVAVRDTDLPPQRPPQASPSSPPLPPTGEYNRDSLPWRDCTSTIGAALGMASPRRVECTELRVDATVVAPAFGNVLKLDLSRVGDGPAPLVVLGEASGEPGTVRAARLAQQLPPALLDRFTLIGMARRGTGPSDPLDCIPGTTRNLIVGSDPDAGRPALLDSLLDTTRTAIQTCVQDLGEVLTTINSTGTAEDLEQLRIVLNAPVLNLVSHGEASRAVTDFLHRYPSSTGRVVLDGAVDPTLDDVSATEATLLAADAGYTAFAADCVTRGCPLGSDPRGALLALAEALRTAPLRAGWQRVTAGIAYQAVLETVGDPQRWPQLSHALAAARDGDGAELAALVAPVLANDRGLPARFDPALATHCNDTATRVSPERAQQLARQWGQRSALFGSLFAARLLWCSAWPVPSAPPVGPPDRALPPVLVVATAGDPVTPAEGATRTAQSLPSATLVSWEGQAHGALPRSSCVVDLVTRFLMDASIPRQGTLCPP